VVVYLQWVGYVIVPYCLFRWGGRLWRELSSRAGVKK
jgi:hypothetical protein